MLKSCHNVGITDCYTNVTYFVNFNMFFFACLALTLILSLFCVNKGILDIPGEIEMAKKDDSSEKDK